MKETRLANPFGAPVYYEETVMSTMDVCRRLAEAGEPHGTVIYADFQEAGRGRNRRVWASKKGENLMFTILLRFDADNLPAALTLRAGLAILETLENQFPVFKNRLKIKWPNDILLLTEGKPLKLAGILAEAETTNDGGTVVYLGVGINLFQDSFPGELSGKAISIKMAGGLYIDNKFITGKALYFSRNNLLVKILAGFFNNSLNGNIDHWKPRLEEKLYMLGEEVTFAEGPAESERVVKGRLAGIGDTGELILLLPGDYSPHFYSAGELRVY